MKKAIKGNHTYVLLLLVFSLLSSAKAQTSPPQNSQNPYMQTNFNPSMAIVIVVLISAFFFLGFFSIYIRQCAGDRLGADSASRPAAAVRRQRGLTPSVIQTLPTMLYSEAKEHKHGKGALECAVCLSEFEDDETLRLLPKCSHVFHTDCIDAWLSGHVTCPVCRDNLSDTKGNVNIQPIELEREVISAQEDETRHDHVVINIIQEHESEQEEERRREEIIELERIGSTRRAMRSKSTRRPPRFPRSHSTGHSLSSANTSGDDRDFDRYTLRLPEPVLRSIIAAGKLKRTASLIEFHTTGEGSNRGTREENSNRGGRSVRSLVRNFSEKLGNWGIGRRGENGEGSIKKGEGEGSTNRGRFVRVQFDCLPGSGGAAAAGDKAEHGAA